MTQIYNNTTIINNVVTGNNNRIINHGVPIDQVRRHTGTEIRQVAIRETKNAAQGTRRERLERDGRTLIVHRPNISQTATDPATSPSFTRDSQAGHRPAAGAGAVAQTENLRGQKRGQVEDARNRTISRPVPAVSGNPRATPPAARPAPLVVQGGERIGTMPSASAPQGSTTLNTPTSQKPPPGSLVVIGRRDSNSGQNQNTNNERRAAPARSPQTWSANQATPTSQPSAAALQVQTPRASLPTLPASLAYNRPTTQTPRRERPEAPRQVAPASRTYSAPTAAAPAPRSQSVAPTYRVPYSTPAPSRSVQSYSAPRSSPTPAPAYTPASSHTPTAAAPARGSSQSERGGSSGGNRD